MDEPNRLNPEEQTGEPASSAAPTEPAASPSWVDGRQAPQYRTPVSPVTPAPPTYAYTVPTPPVPPVPPTYPYTAPTAATRPTQGGYTSPAANTPPVYPYAAPPTSYGVPPYSSYSAYPPPKPVKPAQGMAIASLVLGLCGLLIFFWPLALIATMLGIIFGVIAVVRKNGGLGIAGLIVSAILFLLNALLTAAVVLALLFAENHFDPNAFHDDFYDNWSAYELAADHETAPLAAEDAVREIVFWQELG